MWNIKNRTSPDETDFGGQALMNGLIEDALGTETLYKAGSRPDNGFLRLDMGWCSVLEISILLHAAIVCNS
jgi:hypothetical protein